MANIESGLTELLSRWKDGDRAVEQEIAEQLYPLLHGMAGAQVRRSGGALTLSPTELVNEAYMRLAEQRGVAWRNRSHFFAVSATVLRRVVVDYLRERSAEKRGAGHVFVEISELSAQDAPWITDQTDWLAVDQALTRLQTLDPVCARVVELRLFAGLTTEETAEACETSVATVGRQWRFARAWLAQQLGDDTETRVD